MLFLPVQHENIHQSVQTFRRLRHGLSRRGDRLRSRRRLVAGIPKFILLGFSFLGIIDAIVPRCRRVNKLIMILANKRKMQVARKEQERIKKILEN